MTCLCFLLLPGQLARVCMGECTSSTIFFFGFESTQLTRRVQPILFVFCFGIHKLARQLHQERTPWQMDNFFCFCFESTQLRAEYSRNAHRWRCSNKEARKRLTRRHSRNSYYFNVLIYDCCLKVDIRIRRYTKST